MNPYKSLIDIGIKLTSEQDLDKLLDLILNDACNICSADAGTLYLKEGDKLRFSVSINKTLEKKMGRAAFKELFRPFTIPVSNNSIAGWCAKNRDILNIADVYEIDEAPYSFNGDFDKKIGYRCCSMLTVPIKDREGAVLGVLQLINKEGYNGKVFEARDEEVVESLASQAAVAIRNVRLADRLREAQFETIYKLGLAAEYKDEGTGNHIKRVSEISRIIAESLGMDFGYIEKIYYASPLHDVGKIGIPDNILMKPGRLTPGEWDIMKDHTVLGYRILNETESEIIKTAAEIAYTHHERWDGKGYPRGLSGDEIPISGQIVAISDFFDALTSKRPYRKNPFSQYVTLQMIEEESGKHFAPDITDAFLESVNLITEVLEEHADEE